MAAALLDSKHRMPSRRPHAVARPRLAQRLAAASLPALTIVSAPAGFGKTTVLTESLTVDSAGLPALAWLSLDSRDNDPALFWSYVAAALRTAVPGIGEDALQLLGSPSPPIEAVAAALLNDIGRLPQDVVLILDDYHLIDSPQVHDGMRFLLAHQPAQLHLVLATRADPPFPLARLRARGELMELRTADLRFTAEESAAYLNDCMRLGLSEADVAALDLRAEGWIAALQLAALSIEGREDSGAFIAGFAGDDRYIVDYLVEEVLARLPADTRDFLIRTSVLERLTGSLCDAVTGQRGGTATLVALERANLFVIPLDDKRQWYRYHHLFADVLHAHLLEQHGNGDEQEDGAAALHRRAGAWFDANGDASQAINHALAGGDFGRAADLIELAMPTVRRERREAEAGRWVAALPYEVVQVRPVLAVAFVGVLAQASDFATVARRLSDIESSLRSADGAWPEQPPPGLIVLDAVGFRSVPASIEVFRAALALTQSDLDAAAAHARAALSLTPPDEDVIRSAAGALAGLASWTAGDLVGAHAAYTETVAGLARAGSFADVLGCCIGLADIRRTQGRLRDAVRISQWALDLAAAESGGEALRGTADMQVAMAETLLERDDLRGAAEHLAIAGRLGELNGLPQNPYRRRVVAARLCEAEGDLDSALELLDQADRVYVGDYYPNVRPVPAVRARLWIRRGERDSAVGWATDRQLTALDPLSYLREFEHITLARLLLATYRAERDESVLGAVLTLLERLLAAAQDGDRAASMLEVLVLQSLAEQLRGDVPAALQALERAIALARPEGHVRLFADEGPSMASLLRALGGKSASAGYVRRLLASTARMGPVSGSSRALVDPLSGRELDVLRLLSTDLDGPHIARELSVSLNTLRTHTKNIYAKLGVTSRRAAVSQARELDLLPQHRSA